MNPRIKATLVGGFVMYAWYTFSFMALPWHGLDYKEFKDPKQVMKSMGENLTGEGLYILPPLPTESSSPEDKQKWMEDTRKGPFVYLSARPGGTPRSMGQNVGIQFAMQILVAYILVLIIQGSRVNTRVERGMLTASILLAGGILSQGAYWNWWGFPARQVMIHLADLGIGGFLAGMAISRVLGDEKTLSASAETASENAS